ncbi:MAG: oligosaccharide flippase family protein [Verrucomicrobia bacterium]|nr:oligosaccharide flippase family protein [Verrucomicrobiota bacterium]
MNLRNQLIKNILSNWAFLFLNLVIFFFLTPYIIEVLGAERSGLWFLIGSITGYFGIVAFGIPGATEKYVAEYMAKGDHEQVNRVISTSLFLSLWLAAIALATAAVLALVADRVLTVSAAHVTEARWVMLIIGVDLAFSYPCALMFNVLKGFNRHDVRNAMLIPALLVKAGAFVIALVNGGGVVSLVLIQLATNVASYTAATVWVLRKTPWLHVSISTRHPGVCRLLLTYGAFQFVAMAAGRIIVYTDGWIIASMLSMTGVTVYNVAAKLSNQGRDISSGLDMTLRPAASHLHGLGDTAGLQKLLVTGSRIVVILLGALYIVYLTWGGEFIRLWLPGLSPAQAAGSYCCLLILVGAAFLTTPLGPGISIMYGIARHQPFARLGVIVAVANVGLSIALAFPLGIYGVAIGTVTPLFLIRGLYMYRYLPRIVEMSPWHYLVGVWGQPLLALAPLAAVLIGLRFVLEFTSLWWLMGFLAITGSAYVLWVYLVVLRHEEKQLIHDAVGLVVRRPGSRRAAP